MRSKREHLIGACGAALDESFDPFSEVAQRSQAAIASRVTVAKMPPPEREIALRIDLSSQEILASVSLKRYFGFAFDARLLAGSGSSWTDSISFLDGMIHRVVRDNPAIMHYGFKITLFSSDSEDALLRLYGFMTDWCQRIGATTGIDLTFDIVQNQEEFDFVMLNEHRRMVYGDVKYQYAGALASPWN